MKGFYDMSSKNEIIVNRYDKWFLPIKNTFKEIFRKYDLYDDINYISTCLRRRKNKKFINDFLEHKPLLFELVEIETVNRCNGTCAFCPANKNVDARPYKMMDTELFLSIINQLKELNYSGTLGLYSNNEPFLDNRIASFAKIARESLPNAHINLCTNGTLLTLDKFLDIIPYLDKLTIDNYNDTLELNESSKIIYEYCMENDLYKEKLEIQLRKVNEVLTTRGGQAPNNNKRKTLQIPCILPCMQLVIRPDGKVSLCCSDAQGKFTMGDLTKQPLIEIWNSDKYNEIRSKMKSGREHISLCQFCDTRLSPPKVLRQKLLPER